ncbi:MAG: C25 family cysteine peptidase [Thermoanaerobaculia bacterium]
MTLPLWAGSTGTANLYMPQGSAAGTANGDYLSTPTGSGGAQLPYRYWAEVPAGATRLVVDLFDPDWGSGGAATEAAANRDRDRGGTTFGGVSTYEVYDPAGTLVATATSSTLSGFDNAWATVYDSSIGVPGSVPTFVSATTAITADNDTSTSLGLALPGGTVGTDLLLAFIAKDQDGGTFVAVAAPGGWTLVNEGGCDSNECSLSIFRRFAAGAAGTQTFSWTGGQRAVGAIVAYRGVDPTTPLDVAPTVVTQPNADPTAPAITTSTANTRIVRVVAERDDLAPFGTPAGHTERFDLERDSGGNNQMISSAMADTTQAAAGTNAAATFTDDGTSEPSRGVTIALRAISTPGGAPTAGHWEIRIDNTASGSNDINAIGLRAHDGDSSAGGTEFPVYYDSHTQIGTNAETGANSTRTYNLYPYVTSGCTANVSTFDYDNGNGTGSGAGGIGHGRIVLNSRNGGYTQTILSAALSGDDVWSSNTINTWVTDTAATGYGIWPSTAAIGEYTPDGNSNYANVYFRSEPVGGGAPPPSANPTPNTFRVYLPTDAGATPVKPYLEQLLTYVSGPNPAQVGVQSIYRITVRIVNPTAQAITFGALPNQVVAFVPGAGAVYGGSPVVSQGTVTGQPGIGGTGNVSWNPGSVAAGTTQILSYLVRVTPTSPGQRVVATGTPAAFTGTEARYVDETGNASQTRANYFQGPLCELAITQGLLTKALVTELKAVDERGQVAVEWATTTEDGTAGFDLYRWSDESDDWVLVNDEIVMASPTSSHGARYRVIDPGASGGEDLTYALMEVEAKGTVREAGQFTVRAERGAGGTSVFRGDAMTERVGNVVPAAALERLRAAAAREQRASARIPDWSAHGPRGVGSTKLKVYVRERGLYRVTADDLAAGFGVSTSVAAGWINGGLVKLENQGQPVAWHQGDKFHRGVYFFGESVDSNYTRDNVYWLSIARGQQMPGVRVSAGASGANVFSDSKQVEVDSFAAPVVTTDPESDYWYWSYLVGDGGADGSRDFAFRLSDPVASGNATLAIRFRGATSSGIADEHEAVVFVNGNNVGTTSWTGITDHAAEFGFPASFLTAGGNTVRVEAHRGGGASLSVYYVDGFELTSPRLLRAENSILEFQGDGASTVTVSGFPLTNGPVSSEPVLFDLTNPKAPSVVKGFVVTGSGTGLRFDPATADTPYLALTLESAYPPAAIRADTESDLRNAAGGEYVVVTDGELAAGGAALAAYRQGQGLSTLTVKIEDIYDEFNFGVASPLALKTFVNWAATEWSIPARYVVLAGEGQFDYRNLLGYGGNKIPVLMVSSPDGIFGSDSAYGDLDGDGLPEVAVGRLPVLSNAELTAVLAKIQAYESLAGDWADRLLLIADNSDGAADFAAESDSEADSLPQGYDVTKIYLGPLSAGQAHDAAVVEFQAGAGFSQYVGHGGLDRLADEGILGLSDVAALANGGRAPFLTALTCAINRFELPGLPSFGEEMVRRADGGAVAVFAPSGLGQHGEAAQFAPRLSYEIYGVQNLRVGDAILDAETTFANAGGDRGLLTLYTLIGDPALVLRRPPPPEPDPNPTSGE